MAQGVRIANPAPGESAFVSSKRAQEYIDRGVFRKLADGRLFRVENVKFHTSLRAVSMGLAGLASRDEMRNVPIMAPMELAKIKTQRDLRRRAAVRAHRRGDDAVVGGSVEKVFGEKLWKSVCKSNGQPAPGGSR